MHGWQQAERKHLHVPAAGGGVRGCDSTSPTLRQGVRAQATRQTRANPALAAQLRDLGRIRTVYDSMASSALALVTR